MKKYKPYIITAVIFYLLFIIITIPADKVFPRILDKLDIPLSLSDFHGSIWNGYSTTASFNNMAFKQISWDFGNLALATGKLEYAISIQMDESNIKAIFGKKITGTLYLRNSNLALPVETLLALAKEDSIEIDGTVNISIDKLEMTDQKISSATAKLSAHNLLLPPPLNMNLGSYELLIEPSPEGFKGVLNDLSGPIDAEGLINLKPNGDYELTAMLSIRDQTQKSLSNALRFIGTPDASGKIPINRKGKIPLNALLPLT